MRYKTLTLVAALAASLSTSALAQNPEDNITINENGQEQNKELKVDLLNTPSPGATLDEAYRLAGLPAFDIVQKISSFDLCLDREGDALQLKKCMRTTPTRWVNDGSRLRPKTGAFVDESKCLTTDASKRVVLASCVKPSTSGQLWNLDSKTGWITSKLVNGVCLGAPVGGNPTMAPCGVIPSQVWRASDQYITQGAVKAATVASDSVVTTRTVPILAQSEADGTELCVGGKLKVGAQVELVACQSGDAHQYVIRTFSSGQQAITRFEAFNSAKNKPYGLCLDVQGGSWQPGTPVQLYTCNTSEAQKWVQLEQFGELIAGKAASRMSSAAGPNLCLDAAGGQQKLGVKLIIWGCHLKADNQNFRVGFY